MKKQENCLKCKFRKLITKFCRESCLEIKNIKKFRCRHFKKKLVSILLCLIFLQPVFASWSSDIESMAIKYDEVSKQVVEEMSLTDKLVKGEYLVIRKEDLEKLFNLSWLLYDVDKKLALRLSILYYDIKHYNLLPTQPQKLSLEEELKFLKDRIDLLEKKILKLELDKLSEGL